MVLTFENKVMLLTWATGLVLGVVAGSPIAATTQRVLERGVGLRPRDQHGRLSPILVGYVERTLFVLLVAFNVPGAIGLMAAWVGAKMAAHWQSAEGRVAGSDNRELLNRRFIALISSVVSLSIASIGGLVCRGTIPFSSTLFAVAGVALALVTVIRLLWPPLPVAARESYVPE
jgi:hypothetical protein